MVAVDGNLLQVIGGKQGIQSKTAAKEGNTLNGDFLMALFAAADGHNTPDVAGLLLGEKQEQTQPGAEDQQNLIDLVEIMHGNFNQLQQQREQTDGLNLDKNTLQALLVAVQAQVKETLQLGDVLKQVDAVPSGKLETLLSQAQLQLTPEQKSVLQQVQAQLQNQQSENPQQLVTVVPTQLQGQKVALTMSGQVDAALTKLKEPDIPKEVLQQLQAKQVNEQFISADIKQQSVKVNNIAETPKASLLQLNKVSTEVQQIDQNAVKQESSITSQFVKPVTNRPVEQVLQQVVKTAETTVQSTGQQTVSQLQNSDSQSFSTVVQNKVATMDAKMDLVQPEQLASKLLGMVKEMATKQQPNQTTMHLKLNPEHLGEVTVRLTYNRGELNAQFYAATTHGKEALEAALPQMRDTLFQQQVKLNEATVYLNGGSGNQWLGGRQGNQGGNRGRGQGGYYTSNGLQPKVSAVPLSGNRIVDDGLNILV